jgi:hypothetical protein
METKEYCEFMQNKAARFLFFAGIGLFCALSLGFYVLCILCSDYID